MTTKRFVQANLISGDAFDVMCSLPDKSIDLTFTSPPYNLGIPEHYTNFGTALGDKASRPFEYDEFADCMDENNYQQQQIGVLEELYRVTSDRGHLFYNHKPRTKTTRHNSKGELVRATNEEGVIRAEQWISKTRWRIKQVIIWPMNSSHQQNVHMFTPTYEEVYWLVKDVKGIEHFKNITEKDVIYVGRASRELHNAPYPEELLERIMKYFVGPQTVVLDPYIGSGTTAVVAHRLGAKQTIGIDLSLKYLMVAEERIKMAGGGNVNVSKWPVILDIGGLRVDGRVDDE